MEKTIKHRTVNFLGRNGYFLSTGTSIITLDAGTLVAIQPITSRGIVGRASIEIPIEAVPELIAALSKL